MPPTQKNKDGEIFSKEDEVGKIEDAHWIL